MRRLAQRAAFDAAWALATRDLDEAVKAASRLDEAVDRLDAWVRTNPEGKAAAAALRCERADFLIGFGARLKDKALLTQAESDLAQLSKRLDPAYLPLSWARAEGLRGEALAGLGDLTGDANCLAESVRVLAAACDHVDVDHSPLDRARLSHALGRALEALAEACGDDGLLDHALAAFDQAMVVLEPSHARALRASAAYDRAACVARRAEREGDAKALARAEAAFRAELSRDGGEVDPVSWAVAQLALARVYDARAALQGEASRPPEAAVALTEALDVFVEQGLKTLAEAAQAALERLRGEAEA
jgi:tetratricopeptide (TPR) repeat protein